MGFIKRFAAPDKKDANFYGSKNRLHASGWGMNPASEGGRADNVSGGNCTTYALGRLLENGADYPALVGSAGTWLTTAKAKGYPTGDKPENGAVAVYQNHVLVIEDVEKQEVSDSAYNAYLFRYYKLPNFLLWGQKPLGYIYINRPTPAPTPAPTPTIKAGSNVKLKAGAKYYDGKTPASYVYGWTLNVQSISGDRAVVTHNGSVIAGVKVSDLVLV